MIGKKKLFLIQKQPTPRGDLLLSIHRIAGSVKYLPVFDQKMHILHLNAKRTGPKAGPDRIVPGFPLLLQGFRGSNSHGNGHADHGVVTCEAGYRGRKELRQAQKKERLYLC